ncbi:hypothetical protein BLA60_27190 [Actinophytocola xinjiangensis]|uniref:Uncharacterized protein n=1 Tax=Actinophytocola xinjiangensis TaxID=485602 RepID=A0A7Z1AXD6_9PSEU|nr:hypothetical protein BLA60_27190 [Actinophytocola xinjiangensis]
MYVDSSAEAAAAAGAGAAAAAGKDAGTTRLAARASTVAVDSAGDSRDLNETSGRSQYRRSVARPVAAS